MKSLGMNITDKDGLLLQTAEGIVEATLAEISPTGKYVRFDCGSFGRKWYPADRVKALVVEIIGPTADKKAK